MSSPVLTTPASAPFTPSRSSSLDLAAVADRRPGDHGAIRSTASSFVSIGTTSCPFSCSDSARLEPKFPRPTITNRFAWSVRGQSFLQQ